MLAKYPHHLLAMPMLTHKIFKHPMDNFHLCLEKKLDSLKVRCPSNIFLTRNGISFEKNM